MPKQRLDRNRKPHEKSLWHPRYVAGNNIEEYHCLVVAVQMTPSTEYNIIIKLSDQCTSMFDLGGITASEEQCYIHSRKVIVV